MFFPSFLRVIEITVRTAELSCTRLYQSPMSVFVIIDATSVDQKAKRIFRGFLFGVIKLPIMYLDLVENGANGKFYEIIVFV
jgi:hypothetical protein